MRVKLFNLLFFAGYIVVCAGIFASCGFYLSHRLSSLGRRVREILIAVTSITAVLAFSRWFLDFQFAPIPFLFVFWFSTLSILLLARLVAHRLLYYFRAHGKNLRSIVIVGEGMAAAALADRIEREPTLGYRVLRIIDTKEQAKV